MKIALLGGVFNPPHIGHILVAQQILDFTSVDEVWFLPNYAQHPPKPSAPIADRIAMTGMVVIPRTRVSLLEVEHKLDGQTINLLPHLPPEHDFSFVIGSDQLPVFHLWGGWQELLTRMPFLVFPRYGYPTEPLYQNMTLVSNRLLISTDISSTKIRERVKKDMPVDEFVPKPVSDYIRDKGLYK